MKLDTNNHSVFMLQYHLILVVKYRRKAITDPVSESLKEIFVRIGKDYHIELEEWNHDQDHVHVLFRSHPDNRLSTYINAYKSASSRLIKKQYPQIRKMLWKEMFWSRSYCLMTTGGAAAETIRSYIQSQGAKQDGKNRIQISSIPDR